MSRDLRAPTEDRPINGSRVLTEFKATRERMRREQAAEREMAQAMAAFRRHGRGHPMRQAAEAARAALPAPAFSVISGQRAHGAPPEADRGFSAGASDRLNATWIAFNTGINADLEAALPTLRARSRDWWVNTDAGERYAALLCDNVIGSDPPRLQVRAKLRPGADEFDEEGNQAVEDGWTAWCARGRCELTGEYDFTEVCRTNLASAARDGEFLNRRVRDRQLFHGFALQLLDVDRIDSSRNVAPAVRGGNAIRLGIEIDAYGRKQAGWLYSAHPGDAGAGLAPRTLSERVAMDDLIHAFVLRRPEQVRGYPWTAAVLKRANTLDQYEQWAVVAAKVGAAKMGFYTVDKDVVSDGLTLDQLKDATGELVQDVEAGMLEALPPGVDFKEYKPEYPHQNFDPFVTTHKRDIAAGLNVAHHNLSGNMTGVNYSSARIAELAERRHWRAIQKWFIRVFVRPVFEDWLRMALLTGSIVLPSGRALPADQFEKYARAATFQPPGWAWVDPEADINASAMAFTYDMRSLRQIADEQGIDLEEVLLDKARLKKRYEQLDLPVPPWLTGGAPMTVAGTPKPAPKPSPAPAPQNGASA